MAYASGATLTLFNFLNFIVLNFHYFDYPQKFFSREFLPIYGTHINMKYKHVCIHGYCIATLKLLKTNIFMDFMVCKHPQIFYPQKLANYECSYAYTLRVTFPQNHYHKNYIFQRNLAKNKNFSPQKFRPYDSMQCKYAYKNCACICNLILILLYISHLFKFILSSLVDPVKTFT